MTRRLAGIWLALVLIFVEVQMWRVDWQVALAFHLAVASVVAYLAWSETS